MKKIKSFRTWVFAFITFGVLVIAALITMALKGSGVLTPKVRYWTVFNSAEGISRGTPVCYKGVKIGWVESVTLVPSKEFGSYEVKTTFVVKKRYMNIVGDGMVVVLKKPLIGASSLELVGRYQGNLPPGAFIPSQDTPQGKRMLEKMGMISTAGELIKNASELIAMLKDPSGPLYSSLKKLNQVENEIITLTKRLQMIADKLSRSPLVGEHREIYEEVIRTLRNLRRASENIKRISRRLEKMPILRGKGKSEKTPSY